MNEVEIWITYNGQGTQPFLCGSVPTVGQKLNGEEILLVVPQPTNPNQFLAFLKP